MQRAPCGSSTTLPSGRIYKNRLRFLALQSGACPSHTYTHMTNVPPAPYMYDSECGTHGVCMMSPRAARRAGLAAWYGRQRRRRPNAAIDILCKLFVCFVVSLTSQPPGFSSRLIVVRTVRRNQRASARNTRLPALACCAKPQFRPECWALWAIIYMTLQRKECLEGHTRSGPYIGWAIAIVIDDSLMKCPDPSRGCIPGSKSSEYPTAGTRTHHEYDVQTVGGPPVRRWCAFGAI